MKRASLSALVLVAVFALSAVAASAATPEWWVAGKLLEGTEKLGEPTKITHPVVIKTASLAVECSTVTVEAGAIGAKNENSAQSLGFQGCQVVGSPACEVANIKTEPLNFPLEKPATVIKLRFTPKSGILIAVINVKSVSGQTCLVAGTKELTTGGGEKGGMNCNYPNVEIEAVEHTLEFTATSGSEVKVNGEPAEFIATFAWKLASSKAFSAR